MPAAPNIADYVLVCVPLALCVYLGLRGLLPVFKGKFVLVALAMLLAATAIALLLSFVSFALLTTMDDSVTASAMGNLAGSGGASAVSASTFVLPVARFFAKSRFVRSALVAFTQPSLLSIAGIACCLMLVYVRHGLVRVGADITVLLEHFAVYSSHDQKS